MTLGQFDRFGPPFAGIGLGREKNLHGKGVGSQKSLKMQDGAYRC